MSLVVVTGGARSGKSAAAARLAASREAPVVVLVAGEVTDEEMERRVAAHRRDRDDAWVTREVSDDLARDLAGVPDDSCLLVDCLGSIVGRLVGTAGPAAQEVVGADAEAHVDRAVTDTVNAIAGRRGDTIVVTNEVGDGVVPAFPAGRLFRDALGRANRLLVDRADGAWLCVAGRCLELSAKPHDPTWPATASEER